MGITFVPKASISNDGRSILMLSGASESGSNAYPVFRTKGEITLKNHPKYWSMSPLQPPLEYVSDR